MSATRPSTEIDPRIGTGNWAAFKDYPLEHVFEVASRWKAALKGEPKLWLCWNVSPRWCVVQQRLIKSVGWTPLLGFDPRVGPPPVEPGSILIDFNDGFGFPVMWPHFPLEFAFLFIEQKLAFWHADLLCRILVLKYLVKEYESLADGEMAAVYDIGGRRNYFNFRTHRFWELAGCTTRTASENQYCSATGWWRNFHLHANCTVPEERARRAKLDYDSGVGIRYWKNKYNGHARKLDLRIIKEGHCSEIHKLKTYKAAPNHTNAMRNLAAELDDNYSIDQVSKELGIDHFLPPIAR